MNAFSLSLLKQHSKQYRTWLVTGLVVLLFVLFLWVLPLVISQQFQKWVLENGGEQVSVENVDFNIFTATFAMDNVVIERSGYQPFWLPRLEVKGQWWDLIDKRFVIRSVNLSGVELTVDQSEPDAEHIGGILLEKLAASEDTESSEETTPWSFQVQDLSFSSLQLTYKHQQLTSALFVEELKLSNLDSLPDSGAANLSFVGSLDESPVRLNGELDLFSGEPGFQGNLLIKQLSVEPYLTFISGEKKQQAVISIETKLNANQSELGEISVNQNGELLLEKVKVTEAALALDAETLAWQGNLNLNLSPSSQLEAIANGGLKSAGLQVKTPDAMSVSGQKFAWQGKMDVDFGNAENLKTALDGQFTLNGLDVNSTQQDLDLQNAVFDWQGEIQLEKQDGKLNIVSNGKLQNEALKLNKPQQQVTLHTEALAWQGDIDLSLKNGNFGIQSSSQVKINGLELNAEKGAERVALINETQIEQLEVKAVDQISLGRLSLKDLSVGRLGKIEEVPDVLVGFANFDGLDVEKLNYSESTGLSIERIAQTGMHHVVLKDKSGEWIFNSLVGALVKLAGSPKADDDSAKRTSKQAMPVSIGRIETINSGEIYYVDRSLPATFVQKIELEKFKLSNIASNRVEPSQLELKAKVNNATALVNGNVALFDEDKDFDLTAEISAMSLLPYSYFLEKALGYEVDSGSLNAEGKFKAKGSVLESNTELTLHQLDLRALTEEELKKLDAKQNGSIETGLSMLKDKNDTIKLKIPVNGDFKDIKVDPSDIINQAIGSALKTGAKTYFAAALFPFGTLLVIADAVGDKAMQVNLDPVFFEPEQVVIDSKYQDYLGKVATVLEEKPEIHVKVCGVSVDADKEILVGRQKKVFDQQQAKLNKSDKKSEATKSSEAKFVVDEELLKISLQSIAKQRGEKVSRYLIDNKSVEAKRLIPCQPRLDLDNKESSPRTELSL